MSQETIKFEFSDTIGNHLGKMSAHQDFFVEHIIPELNQRGAEIEKASIDIPCTRQVRKCDQEPVQTDTCCKNKTYPFYRVSLDRLPFDLLEKIYDDLYPKKQI